MTLGIVAATLAAVFLGATLQRLSGTGVGLVVAPVLALLMGPALGVFMANATTMLSGTIIMLAVLKDVDWRRYLIFLPAGILGAIPAALLVRELSAAWLNIVIGLVVVAALALTFGTPRVRHIRSRWLTAAGGAAGAFLNTSAGVAAPAMVIYAKFARWPQRSFAATMQPTFATFGALSVGSKLAVGAMAISQLPPWWLFPVIFAAVGLGIIAGGRLARLVTAEAARRLAITLAGAGAVVALVRGLVMLAG